jgi:hypothetical protein
VKKILTNALMLAILAAALISFSGIGAASSADEPSVKGADNPGSCSCELIDGKCRVERNKCKSGFKPRCIDLGKEECDCECVQK